MAGHALALPGVVPRCYCYAALLDAESWPSWTSYYEVEKPARVDDLRTIRSRLGRVCCRERIIELVPDQRFSYEQAAGPFASHRASVDLTRAPHGGTNITWSATYRHALPLLDTLRDGAYRSGPTISLHTPTQS
ncbi:SRPBCC family protein [Streptomyces sp. NPDC050619]|uniref:SRPBCC family protein n=1 Tax=Streptomyces sp. NPDC050619 TaxID=3157214 RepID=UPI003415C033